MAAEVVESTGIPAYSYAEVVRSLVTVQEDPDELVGHSLVETISACEQVIRAAQALQAEASVALLREREQAMTGRQAHLSTIGETSLARGVASSTAARQVETALAITAMPSILAGWRDGLINEATARAITTALPALAPDELALVEAELEPLLPSLTPRKAGEIVRGLVIEIDPDAADAKALTAREDRYVLVHDEADAMAALIAHGPAEQVHALKNALTQAADALVAAGDPRTRGQIMFDTLHTHTLTGDLTGLLEAPRHGYTVEIGILMTTDQLQNTTDAPAVLEGHGPIAPAIADEIVNDADQVFYRRIITDPVDHTLRSVDTQRRLFTGPLARFVRARDKNRCRKPWCTAPGRHTDHIHPHHTGGPTTATNAQRLCVQDHLIKHLPGWQLRPHPDGHIQWTTPTGHTYTSHTPQLT